MTGVCVREIRAALHRLRRLREDGSRRSLGTVSEETDRRPAIDQRTYVGIPWRIERARVLGIDRGPHAARGAGAAFTYRLCAFVCGVSVIGGAHVGMVRIVMRMIPTCSGNADMHLGASHPLVMARAASQRGSRRHSLDRESDHEQPQQGNFERSIHRIARQSMAKPVHGVRKL